jgi:predicted ArsR family transcriptional regulator
MSKSNLYPGAIRKVLAVMAHEGSGTASAVATATGLNRQTVSRILAQMRRDGQATSDIAPVSHPSGKGRGHVMYTLTPDGYARADYVKDNA